MYVFVCVCVWLIVCSFGCLYACEFVGVCLCSRVSLRVLHCVCCDRIVVVRVCWFGCIQMIV